jgi:hypothetical protein
MSGGGGGVKIRDFADQKYVFLGLKLEIFAAFDVSVAKTLFVIFLSFVLSS